MQQTTANPCRHPSAVVHFNILLCVQNRGVKYVSSYHCSCQRWIESYQLKGKPSFRPSNITIRSMMQTDFFSFEIDTDVDELSKAFLGTGSRNISIGCESAKRQQFDKGALILASYMHLLERILLDAMLWEKLLSNTCIYRSHLGSSIFFCSRFTSKIKQKVDQIFHSFTLTSSASTRYRLTSKNDPTCMILLYSLEVSISYSVRVSVFREMSYFSFALAHSGSRDAICC